MSREDILKRQYEKAAQRTGTWKLSEDHPVCQTPDVLPVEDSVSVTKSFVNAFPSKQFSSARLEDELEEEDSDRTEGYFGGTEEELGDFFNYCKNSADMRAAAAECHSRDFELITYRQKVPAFIDVTHDDSLVGSKIINVYTGVAHYAQAAAILIVHDMEKKVSTSGTLIARLLAGNVLEHFEALKMIREMGLLSLLDHPKLRRKCLLVSGGMMLWLFAREMAHIAFGDTRGVSGWTKEQDGAADELATCILEKSPFSEFSFESRLLWMYAESFRQISTAEELSNAKRRLEAHLQTNKRKACSYGFLEMR